ncbi:thiazole tautomerase (transcriptional regulator TenI) [Melghirimyces profundicolus]|uniref:Thiazole tautomerase (Transcriptional regulator TenI) n=1 Tax=Melghirimyces profundicolus TaxID=1242148 RepID=A0A2T6C9E2_9BACL|nr:thiamine phosphate synthase [Melghirimyces profundicolus]PTX64921.1 thiazole tautomerase (transcriptional regulator TenI) [Melghirimyces profundicolus]
MGELHYVSAPHQTLDQLLWLCRRIGPWVDRIHLRKKEGSAEALFRWAKALLEEGRVKRGQLVINGSPEVARTLGCAGIHLPEREKPEAGIADRGRLQVGCSVHSVESAVKKEREGADWLFFGHVFPSGSKPGLPPKGTARLREAAGAVRIPVLAIGGITGERVPLLSGTGCAGVAVISALSNARDPGAAARRLKEKMRVWEEET